MEKIIIYTDGGARGNPGPAGIGALIMDADETVLKEISEYIGHATNNIAEYTALVRALEETQKIFGGRTRDMEIEVRMDSELVVRQLSGAYKVKDQNLKEKFSRIAHMRMEDFPNIVFVHVRREKNAHADKLVNAAIDEAVK